VRRLRGRKGLLTLVVALAIAAGLSIGATAWLRARYDTSPNQALEMRTFSNADYPEDPEDRGLAYGNYPHGRLKIQQTGDTRFRFVLEPASSHATTIELQDVDLAYLVASVPEWVRRDQDLTKVGLIDREWNRQQVSFRRHSGHVQVHEGGDGFEQLARNCLWELLLFNEEEGAHRLYAHYWFTFPLGLYKALFERVNGLSYWNYWWSLEHWVDPAGTPVRLDRLRTVEREWSGVARAHWDESPATRGEQALKRKNVLSGAVYTYRDWYTQPIRFASFIAPGRYDLTKPRDTKLDYLASFTTATLRKTRTPARPDTLFELELRFRRASTGVDTRLIIGGLDLNALPRVPPDRYDLGWQAPMGIANPSFVETYDDLLAHSPLHRPFYSFHLVATAETAAPDPTTTTSNFFVVMGLPVVRCSDVNTR
jgi:hypothetical protein